MPMRNKRPIRMPSPNPDNKRLRVAQLVAAVLGLCAATPVLAQDVRGLEVCTAEKQMDRRTGCLQANVEFLQGVIDRNARDARQKLDAAAKELAAARTEINTLKAALAATQTRLDKLEQAKPDQPKGK
jgi:septal ring factor EnvC (AmiA/AmiB activator)